jgi:3D (Asp-Asp-Asp) domain-containing protein
MRFGLIMLSLGVILSIVSLNIEVSQMKEENSQLKEKIEKLEKYDEEVGKDSLHVMSNWREVRVTVYHPTGNPTASGDIIPKNYKRKKHGWVAISRELLEEYPMGSTIVLKGVSPEVDGEYIVKDKTNKRIKNTIDILVRRSSSLYGKWYAKVKLKQ